MYIHCAIIIRKLHSNGFHPRCSLAKTLVSRTGFSKCVSTRDSFFGDFYSHEQVFWNKESL